MIVAKSNTKPNRVQLDYLKYARQLKTGQLHIHCLRIGQDSMLLLEKVAENNYRRIGVSHNFSQYIFDRAVTAIIGLV